VSYDEITNRMHWKDELIWVIISVVSGILLVGLFIYFEKFTTVNNFLLATLCCAGFYVLSILIRAQNQRGKSLTGKAGIDEKYLKFIFPILGFGVGLAILFLN
jgi:hypothetical protein